jgi:ABC-type nitrate/sulfonate/bicarbonate transport system substrate-binding protein/outer membrane protein OmpA-like peptidoglycan-associated protein
MAGRPKAGFYIAVVLVVAGLIALAFMRRDKAKDEAGAGPIAPGDMPAAEQAQAEAPDEQGITTAKEYNYVPSAKLPAVKGVSNYKPMADRTVRFAINVWAGWAPIVYANEGFKAKKSWQTPGGAPFKVDLVLIDDPVAMRDALVAGDVHIGWATVDMLPLLLEGLHKDSRVMPRVFQQIDWSNGGDGIVVREAIKSIGDLRGKTVVLAQNSPSHFFILNALINAGVQPAEVKFKFTQDAFQAAAAFNADKSLAGCVSWAPDIYNLAKVKGNKLIVSTATANKLISDVWFSRADFAKDSPEVIEGLVRGIFDAMVALKDDPAKQSVAKWMSKGFSIPEADALGMLADAHSTNYAENRDFFLNQNNPTNFERTFGSAAYLYRRINAVSANIPFDQIVDFSVIKKLGGEPKYADQQDEYQINFAPRSASSIQAESDEILTKTVVIQFYPNSWELDKKITRTESGVVKESAYDPNVPFVIEEVGKLAGQYGAARIVIEGHTDASMRGRIPPDVVKGLASARADSVKTALLKQFKSLQPNQLAAAGVGWDRPADVADPMNHAKNRRVEIKVYPLEAVPAQ